MSYMITSAGACDVKRYMDVKQFPCVINASSLSASALILLLCFELKLNYPQEKSELTSVTMGKRMMGWV